MLAHFEGYIGEETLRIQVCYVGSWIVLVHDEPTCDRGDARLPEEDENLPHVIGIDGHG